MSVWSTSHFDRSSSDHRKTPPEAPADTVFECGLLAEAAYFVSDGEFVYELRPGRVLSLLSLVAIPDGTNLWPHLRNIAT